MIARSLAALADVTGGTLSGIDPGAAAGLMIDAAVVTDSREAVPGSLYVARVGASADGHEFIAAAAASGARAALVTRDVGPLPRLVVPDEQAAFAAIARHLIDSSPDLAVVGITGSSGKTSTKDLLGQVLAAAGETVAPIGSYNSEVGVPLTVCRMTPTTRYLVVELGARGLGHVRYLTQIAPPSIGIVLNVGSAHVGEFGSRAAIAEAKSELVQALPARGLAILNADDPLVAAMAERTPARVVLVGESPAADLRATDIELAPDGTASFRVASAHGTAQVRLAVAGRHQVGNALAVIAAALELGMPLDRVVSVLATCHPVSRYRMEVSERADGVTIVNDAYNANPESMTAALDTLAVMGAGRRIIAVLGPMLELGEESGAAHRAVGAAAAARGVHTLIVVGDLAREIGAGAKIGAGAGEADPGLSIRYAADLDSAYDLAVDIVAAGDIVLVKSSNGAGLRFLGDRLRDAPVPQEEENSC
ncbi:MAG TPA: UDP-N-acetylmuramoyl-tripeptide--D-alanyl-D-alanine ligase [Tetrasphaera sp.]|nr:UDP-N-acetylmuramoyl-tripeptide--D-alanyl-D-alanine ligase [Tetrasphaera sp.]